MVCISFMFTTFTIHIASLGLGNVIKQRKGPKSGMLLPDLSYVIYLETLYRATGEGGQ